MGEHSSLGGSGAERWINCPGSVKLLQKLNLPPSDETDYRTLGIAAHEAAAHCLRSHLEAWEVIGEPYGHPTPVVFDEEMAKAVQVYLDFCNPMIAKAAEGQGETFVEHRLARPDVHPDYFGTLDFSYYDKPILHVVDYKNGRLEVDAEWNYQMMYYAYGKLLDYPDTKTIYLTIVQPRAFKSDPVDTWMISRADLDEWAKDILIPAMHSVSQDLDAGSHCRWCPAKLVCPLLTGLFRAAMLANPKEVINLDNDSLGRGFQYIDAVGFYVKAYKEECMRRLLKAESLLETKLVAQKSKRVWKPGAEEIVVAHLGEKAWTERELLSPAQVDKLDTSITGEWAYMPQTGLTVAKASDKRPAVNVETAGEAFGDAGLKAAKELE